jgi:HAD superfamily hydrolase (TIGR01509 family)
MGTFYFKNQLLSEPLKNARLVIFDMNGLIIDDESIQLESFNRVLDAFNVHIDEDYWINDCVGKNAHIILKGVLQNQKIVANSETIVDLVNKKNRLYSELISHTILSLVRPGVLEIIEYLTESQYHTLALATSALPEEIEAIVGEKGLDLKHKFTYILNGLDVAKSKPDPEIFKRLVEIAGIAHKNCLVFEDSGFGVLACYEANIPCIAVPNRYTKHQDFRHARFVIDNLTRNAQVIPCTK